METPYDIDKMQLLGAQIHGMSYQIPHRQYDFTYLKIPKEDIVDSEG